MSYINRQYSKQLDDGRWEHAFSQSFISSVQHCPEQARAQWAGELPRDYTDSTALGESMHEGIQYLLHEKRDAHLDGALADAIGVAIHHLDGLEWKYTKISRAFMYERLPQMIEAFHENILPKVDPKLIEHPFSVLLYQGKHRTVRVCGTMDCVDMADEPWDWKSAGSEHEVWEHQRWAVQPSVYAYATWMLGADEEEAARLITNGLPESLFHYGVVMHNCETQLYDVWRDEGHVSWLRAQCSQIAWMIEHGQAPWQLNDHGWWCSEKWCGKWADCKGAHVAVEWKSKA